MTAAVGEVGPDGDQTLRCEHPRYDGAKQRHPEPPSIISPVRQGIV